MTQLPPGVEELLGGADEEFEQLQSEIAAFFKSKPYEIVTEHNADFTEHSLRMEFIEPIPKDRWGRLFYLGVQQLRSAMDHLIYAIAVHESRQDPPPNEEKLAFPVMTNPPDFPMWRIELLSDEVKAAIQSMQPDPNQMERSTLWQLEKFNSSDKHRILRTTIARHGQAGLVWASKHGGGKITNTWHLVALEDKAPFHVVTTEHAAPDVEVGAEITIEVSIERVGGHGQPQDFIPLKWVIHHLRGGVRAMITTVAEAAGL